MKKVEMRRLLLAANYLILLCAVGGWFYASFFAVLRGTAAVAELDRNQVFNVEKLAEYDSKLAENLRYNVSAWIQEPLRDTVVLYALMACIAAIVNVVGLHCLGRRTHGNDQAR